MFNEPTDKNFELLVAENRFVNDLLLEIERVLNTKDMSQADLARALGISEPRVSQILSGNGKNLQARTIARIAFVLGMQAEISFADVIVSACSSETYKNPEMDRKIKEWLVVNRTCEAPAWEGPSNDDDEIDFAEFEAYPEREAA